LDASVFGDAFVLRKVLGEAQSGEIRLHDEYLFSKCEEAALVPRSPAGFERWMDAMDYLCADAEASVVLRNLLSALLEHLSRSMTTDDLVRQINPHYLDPAARAARRVCIKRSLGQSPLPREASHPPPASAPPLDAPGRQDRDSAAVVLRLIGFCQRAWTAISQWEDRRPSPWWRQCRSVLCSALLGLADTPRQAAEVLLQMEVLGTMVSYQQSRWLSCRAAAVLQAAEALDEPIFLRLDWVKGIQDAYCLGQLDLATLLGLSYTGASGVNTVYLLPGCPGRSEVERVATDDAIVRRRSIARYPWLQELWGRHAARGERCYMTGSALTAMLLPRTAAGVPPSDLDLFVEDAARLERSLSDLQECLATHGDTMTSNRVSCHKFRVRVQSQDSEWFIDLYAHPLRQVARYHMSVVRVAFDGESLLCTPSAAIALATSVSTCFDMRWKPERAGGILLRKWSSGLNLLVTRSELHAFCVHGKRVARLKTASDIPTTRLRALTATSSLSTLRINTRQPSESWQMHEQYSRWRKHPTA
jgi:hypothetical protein